MRNTLLAAMVVAALSVAPAHAAYYVVDDDQPQSTQMAPSRFDLPFEGRQTALPRDVRDMLDDLTDLLRNNYVQVLGHTNKQVSAKLAQKRAALVRNYLRRKGIPFYMISVETAPDDSLNGVSIRLGNAHNSAPAYTLPGYNRPQPYSAPSQARPAPSSVMRSPGDGQMNDAIRIFIANKLLDAGSDKRIDPAVALSLISEFLQSGKSPQAQEIPPVPASVPVMPAHPLPTAQLVPQSPIAVFVAPAPSVQAPAEQKKATFTQPVQPVQVEPAPQALEVMASPDTQKEPTWKFDKTKTLRDNILSWSQTAGYKLDWQPDNYFRITRAPDQMKGDFVKVVDAAAKSAGLKVDAYPTANPPLIIISEGK